MRTAATLAAALATAIVLTTGCAQKAETLKPLESLSVTPSPSAKATVNFCTDPAFDQKQVLKTIIILDHSGSNRQNYKMAADGSGEPALPIQIDTSLGTDPQGLLRYGSDTTPGTLLNYLKNLPPNDPLDPSKFFALVNFSSDAETYPAQGVGFTSDTVAFYNRVVQDAGRDPVTGALTTGPADTGATSYLAALEEVQKIVGNDIQAAKNCAALAVGSPSPGSWCPKPGIPVASSYVIVFMSDGSPIIETGIALVNGVLTITGAIVKESAFDILAKVGALASLTSETKFVTSVNFFTIYYYTAGNTDNNAKTLLANMARLGNGVAYNALSGSSLDYAAFQPPKRRVKYELADVFVTNASTAWQNDGQIHHDADMDGIGDEEETTNGTNPAARDSNGDGVSDLVDARSSSPASVCTGNRSKASDPDGLTDCEKILLQDQAGIYNPDSNGDMIPDWLEFKNGIPFQAGTLPAVNTPLADGYTLYQKVKYSLPVDTSIATILNPRPSKYNLQLLSSTADRDCYKLTVNDLPRSGDNNVIRVDIVEKSELLKENYLYRVATKTIPTGQTSVIFNDWNNAVEITNNTWKVWPLQ